ncbi:MAG: DUF2017 family protein [Actinomycetota bacterium]
MADFRPAPGGATLALDEIEAGVLRQLAAEMRALLAGNKHHDDAVWKRLFPAAYEQADDQTAYEDLVGDDLTKHKLDALDMVSTALGDGAAEVTITGDDLGTWLACLTDLRLAMGVRLDVDEERMSREVDPRDPDAQALTVLHWLGWLQEGLLRSLDG